MPLSSNERREILDFVTGRSLEERIKMRYELSDGEREKVRQIEKAIEEGMPLAYLIGRRYFYGREFLLTPDVLIPRPETEGLCEIALSLGFRNAIDFGTGSGCIAITLQLESGKKITAVDVSEQALCVARKNAMHLGATVDFVKGSIFDRIKGRYDLIISNPPYIKREQLLELEVFWQEPTLALDGGIDGLDFYRGLFSQLDSLETGGYFLFEIGEEQGQEIMAMGNEFDLEGELRKDLAGRDRYYIGRKVR